MTFVTDPSQTFMKQLAIMTPERPDRGRRTRSAEPQSNETRRSKSSTGKGKATQHRDRNPSPAQRDDRMVLVQSVLQ